MLEEFMAYATRSAGALGVYLLTFWKADDQLTEQGRKHIYSSLTSMTTSADAPLAIMDRYFSRDMPITRFAGNTLLFSCASLAILLVLYISLTEGFWSSLAGDPTARSYFLRQIATNGIPIVFAVNFVGFALYAGFARPGRPGRSAIRALAIDVPTRIALFFVLTAIIYVASAHLFGSFAGNPASALRAVGPTLALGATFSNLSGVYLYATVISAFPLFIAALLELMEISPRFSRFIRGIFFFLPFENRPLRSLAAVFGVFFALFAAVVAGLASLL